MPAVFGPTFRLTSTGVIIMVTLIAFEAMSVATALPTAARQLHGLASYGWSFTGFLIANNVALIASGVLCDRRGPRPSLVGGLLLFLTGLLTAGLAQQMWQLIAGRVVQGLASGLLLTALYVIIGENYPDSLRPKVMAAISSAWILPSLVGPPLSGLLTEHTSWRVVFLGLTPLVVLGGVLMAPVLRGFPASRRRPPADPSGSRSTGPEQLVRAVALAIGLALLVQAGQHPRLVWLILAPFGLALVGWGLVRLMPAGTFRLQRGVPTTVALRGLFAGALFGADTLIPLSLTVQHGYSATAAGLPLLLSASFWALGSWWQGRDAMSDHRPLLIRIGFLLVAVACGGAAVASVPAMPGWLMYPAWLLAGVGAGLAMSSVSVLMLGWTNDVDRGRDSAAIQLADGVVSSFTTGLGGVLVAAAAHAYIGYTAAFVSVDLAMVGVALVGAAAASRTRLVARP